MIEFKHVLCPTDLSPASRPALTYAAAIAVWYDAQLTLLHVVPTFDAIQVPPGTLGETVQIVYPSSREEVLATLAREAEASGAAAAKPALEVEAGDPIERIVDRGLTLGADLIVVGTHGRTGIGRALVGSVAERVLHRASCPVLTVPPHVGEAGADVTFKRVLCAMDFSPAAMQALGFALDLARQANGTLTLLHVVEWLAEEEPRVHTHFNVPEYRAHLVEDARARLAALVAGEERTWCEIEPFVTTGRAYREILRVAGDRDIDLVVMGAQGRGGLGLALAGSATQQVVRTARCPVLTVHGAPAAAQPAAVAY